MWRQLPPFSFQSRVEIVNVNDRYPEEFVDAISINSPQQLPRGHLIPDLRRGNRYKIVDFSLDTSTELLVDSPNFDQNVEIVNTDQDNAHQHIESENSEKMGNFDYYEQFNERRKFDLPDAPIIFDQQNQENLSPRGVGPLAVLTDKEQEELARALIGVQQPLNDADWFNYSSQDFPNMIQSASSTLCSNFEDSITVGTGGAPGPPKNTSSDKVLKHTRPSRPKRQAQKERAQQRRSGVSNNPTTSVPPGPSFTEEDFPPLG
uniref:Uncharacterized protein n=1 Tax=Caenorhabditis tropicalis TaxID=1561998 RepID=A0A1I7T2J0_9PELO